MKNIFILLILFSSFLFAEIDERRSDIYYGNGILTTKDEARASKDLVRQTVLKDIHNNNQTEMDKLHNFDLAYNYSAKEDFESTAIAATLDLLESYSQLTNTSFSWLAVDVVTNLALKRAAIISNWTEKRIKNYLKDKGLREVVATFLAKQIVGKSKEALLDIAKLAVYDPEKIHDDDLKEMIRKYTTSINDGHGVILVTHSQGNLFALMEKLGLLGLY